MTNQNSLNIYVKIFVFKNLFWDLTNGTSTHSLWKITLTNSKSKSISDVVVQIEIVSSSLSRSSSTGIHGPPRSVPNSDRKMVGMTRRLVIPRTSGRSTRWSSHDPTIKSQLKLSDFDGIRSFLSENNYNSGKIFMTHKLWLIILSHKTYI